MLQGMVVHGFNASSNVVLVFEIWIFSITALSYWMWTWMVQYVLYLWHEKNLLHFCFCSCFWGSNLYIGLCFLYTSINALHFLWFWKKKGMNADWVYIISMLFILLPKCLRRLVIVWLDNQYAAIYKYGLYSLYQWQASFCK